jgi:hypothetical protein
MCTGDYFTAERRVDGTDANVIRLTWSGDAAPFMGLSLSPITSMILNMCPERRFTPSGMLMLALLPPHKAGKTSMKVLYTTILKRMAYDGCFVDFDVYDAYHKIHTTKRIEFHLFIEDLKGLPYLLSCRTTGAVSGACPWCEVVGFKLAGAARYFTAITLLPEKHQLRNLFEAEFVKDTGIVLYLMLTLYF